MTLRSFENQLGQEEGGSVDKANLGLGKGASEHITLPKEASGHLPEFPLPFSMFLQQGDSPLASQT